MRTWPIALTFRNLPFLVLLVVVGCNEKWALKPTTIQKEKVIGVVKCSDRGAVVEGEVELDTHVAGPLLALSIPMNDLHAATNVKLQMAMSDALYTECRSLLLRIEVMNTQGEVVYRGVTGAAYIEEGGALVSGRFRFWLGGLRPFLHNLSKYCSMTNRIEEYVQGKDVDPFRDGRLEGGRTYRIKTTVLAPCRLTNAVELVVRQYVFDSDPDVWESKGRVLYEDKEKRIRDYLRRHDTGG